MNFQHIFSKIQSTRVRRFVIPIVIVIMMKIFMFSLIQWSIIQRPDLFSINFWWEMFTFWDGGWYNLIARYGYHGIPKDILVFEHRAFGFAPGFPIMIRGLGLLIGNFTASQVLLSSIFGILWIPIFQLVTEQYLSQEEALSVTLIASLFPMIFLFTSVGYSEGLFFTLLLSSWYFYLKNRNLLASVLLAGASMVRFAGIILIVPMIIESIVNKKGYRAFLYSFPFILDFTWLYFGYMRTGNFFVSFDAQKSCLNRIFLNQYILPTFFQRNPDFPFNLPFTESFIGLVIGFLVIFILLVVKVYQFDWRLGIYSTLTFFFIVYYGNTLSFPRYMSLIFPIWFLFRMKKKWWFILVIFILGFCDLITGYLFARWVLLG